MEKVIITVATTGSVTPKSTNPHIPLTPSEIAEDVYQCWQAGAAACHLHMRDDQGMGTMDVERFEETVRLIRSKCDIVINLTTSGQEGASDETRMAHLIAIKPEMASYDAGTINWMPYSVFLNAPQFLAKLGKTMIENNIKPELEIFDSGMIHNTEFFMEHGYILRPPHYQFVLGVLGGAQATVENLLHLRNKLPQDATWSAFGIGKAHIPIMLATIALGGHIRVGLEDNVYYSKGRLATNVELVSRAARIIGEVDKQVATPDDARAILGLKKP